MHYMNQLNAKMLYIGKVFSCLMAKKDSDKKGKKPKEPETKGTDKVVVVKR